MENVLVVGANGAIGKKVVHQLVKTDGYSPIAMVRKEEQLGQFEDKGIKTVLADLEKDVSHTGKNIDKIVFAAGSKGKNLKAVDLDGAKKMVEVGRKADIKKFVMLSSMGANQPETVPSLKDYLVAKQKADDFLKASLLPYSIVRPGALTDEAGTGKIRAQKSLGEQGSISRDDVAKALVASLSNDVARDTTYEILSGSDQIKTAVNSI
ncbi:MAG: SDR family oxidoreductase [Vicingaceae bacterium]